MQKELQNISAVKTDTESVSRRGKVSISEILNNSKYVLIILAFASFLIPFLIGSHSLHSKVQLGMMDGMAEEYLSLGINLHQTGKYQVEENRNFFFRPPGYPYFISFALKFYNKAPQLGERFSSLEEKQKAVSELYGYLIVVHNILFGLTVLIFFGIALHFHKQILAFFLALLFGCNPYFIILAGLFHYEILHIFLLSLGTFFLIKRCENKLSKTVWLIISGLCFGLATLVRPITLILPLFIFIAFLLIEKKKFVPAAAKTLIFSFCMLIIIAPYSWRNYQLSNTFIPVNAQSGIALWSGTVKPMSIQPNHYRWWNLWYTEGRPIYQKVTGMQAITKYSWARYNLELEKEFKKEAYSNIKKQPLTYVYNVMINFISINFCINSVFLKIFDYIQLPGKKFYKAMLQSNNDQTFYKDSQSNLFTLLVIFLTACSGIGIYFSIKNNDLSIITILAVYLCVTTAHSITYMDIMYYYVKMPFLFIFFAYFLKHLTSPKNKKIAFIRTALVVFPGLLTLILLFNLILN